MRFRNKVLVLQVLILSICLGGTGYLMIHRNFEQTLDSQLKSAVGQNAMIETMVQYELMDERNREDTDVSELLQKTGAALKGQRPVGTPKFNIVYDNAVIFASDEEFGKKMYAQSEEDGQYYVIQTEGDRHYMYVSSFCFLEENRLCIITKSDISQVYELMLEQVDFFRGLIIVVLLIASVLMYLMSIYLTAPLEKLKDVSQQIAKGDYGQRVVVSGGDEFKILAEQFNQMAEAVEGHVEELKDMLRRRDQFVADFTHEIKTPMTAIIGYADTLRSMKLPEEMQMMAYNYIVSEGTRLESLSKKLFQLIYLREHELEMELVHTGDFAKLVEQVSVPILQKDGVMLKIEVEPYALQMNQELVVTAFLNLIDNARKASKSGDVIEFIGKVQENHTYLFEIIDHGNGIEREELEHICDEFYMVDKSRARKAGGAGLGLSLVALIVKKHGAKLLIESEPQVGTRVKLLWGCQEQANE